MKNTKEEYEKRIALQQASIKKSLGIIAVDEQEYVESICPFHIGDMITWNDLKYCFGYDNDPGYGTVTNISPYHAFQNNGKLSWQITVKFRDGSEWSYDEVIANRLFRIMFSKHMFLAS